MRSFTKATNKQAVLLKFEVDHTDGTTRNIADRVRRITVGSDVDRKDWYCRVDLTNHPNLNSLDPLDSSSTLNKDGSSVYDPLLERSHDVRAYIRKDAGDSWELAFQGYALGASSHTEVEMDDTVSFEPYGISSRYKRDQRMSKWVYEGRTIADLTASVLADSEFSGNLAHVVVEDNPNFAIDTYATGEVTTWEALQNAVHPTGYVLACRYKANATAFNDGSALSTSGEGFYPVLYDPLRYGTGLSAETALVQAARGVDATFTGQFSVRDVEVGIEDVRNFIQLYYYDRTIARTNNIIVSDSTSRDNYGIPSGGTARKYCKMRLVEERGSCIDTEGEAEDYAYACLHDLMDPTPDVRITIPYVYPNAEPHDYIRFVGNDYTIDVGVMSVEWTFDVENQVGQTIISGTVNKVIGERAYWLGQDLTEEERQARYQAWLLGAMEKLPTPSGLHLRTFVTQGDDGTWVSAVHASWNACRSWQFDHTDVWASIGREGRWGSAPYTQTRKNYAMISPVPTGAQVWVRVKHIPWNPINDQGRAMGG